MLCLSFVVWAAAVILERGLVRAFFEFVERHPFAWRMLFREPAGQPEIAQAHREIQHQITQAIAQLIAQVPDVQLASDIPRSVAIEMLAETIKSTNNSLAAWWWDHRDLTAQQLTDFSIGVLWKGLQRLATPVIAPEAEDLNRGHSASTGQSIRDLDAGP